MSNRYRILFVCLGNICRSPMAEGTMSAMLHRAGMGDRIFVDSAGTGAWHQGNPPDRRGQATIAARGIDISDQRARQVTTADFTKFDLILAMDSANLSDLHERQPETATAELAMFTSFAPSLGEADIPDPYYGGLDGYELSLDLIEQSATGLLAHLESKFTAN